MTLSTYAQRWLELPEGGDHFTNQRDLIRIHNWGCDSLEHVWLPRRNGRSCPSDLDQCDDCRLTFFNEGLGLYDTDTDWDVALCQCCAKRRGLT